MQKRKLTGFINRFLLGKEGSSEVLLDFSSNEINTAFYGPDRSLMGFVKLKTGGASLGKIGLYNSPILSLLNAFNDDDMLNITPKTNSVGTTLSLEISNNDVLVNATVGDIAIIPELDHSKLDTDNMKLINEPPYDIEFTLDGPFMEQFKRFSSAASSEIVGFELSNGTVQVIMNYSTHNTNQIKYSPVCSINNDTDFVICFKVPQFIEIFNQNKGATGKLYISKLGLARIDLEDVDFVSRYYPIKVITQN